jgi:Flp pilus assembly protein TadG
MSPQPTAKPTKSRKGYVMLATAISVFVIIGMLGLAVDLGRLFIIKSEAQAFADSAAILAATKLDGKNTGLTAATNAVTGSVNRFNFNTQTIPSNRMTVEFATSKVGPWLAPASIGNAKGYGFVRVTVQPQLSMSFIQSVKAPTTSTVTGQAIGAQIAETFPSGGYMPFTPFALNPVDPSGNFGMSPGQEYSFLWPGNAKKNDACNGNQVNWPQYNFSDNDTTEGSNRGYFELQAASAIADAIQGLRQTSPLAIGDIINLTNGQKQAMQTALEARASYDTDLTPYNPTSSGVAPNYYGNGMRLVVMPVNGGSLSSPQNVVLGFAAFLLPINYPNGGNKTWCAIYMGSRTSGGFTSAYDGAGSYVVRLVL